MAIFELFTQQNPSKSTQEETLSQNIQTLDEKVVKKKDRLFSSLITRMFFLFLLFAAFIWAIYATSLLIFSSIGAIVTAKKVKVFKQLFAKACLMFKRCLICALGLFVGLFSPSFGIVLACTYFLMYDKEGLEEVVPTSLQTQFKSLFKEGELS